MPGHTDQAERTPAPVTMLYRLFDGSDRLLYVGISDDFENRMARHRRESPWWFQVAHTDVGYYLSRAVAQEDESLIIKSALPLYNRQLSETPMNVTRDFPAPREVSSGQLRNRMADVVNAVAVRKGVTYLTNHGRRVAALVPVEVAEAYERAQRADPTHA